MNKTLSSKKTNEAVVHNSNIKAPRLPAAAAHNYICDMLNELTQIAEASELKELSALLRVTTIAAETHERFL